MLNRNYIKKRLSLKVFLNEDSSLPQVLPACSRDSVGGGQEWEAMKEGDRGIVEGRRR